MIVQVGDIVRRSGDIGVDGAQCVPLLVADSILSYDVGVELLGLSNPLIVAAIAVPRMRRCRRYWLSR